MKVIMVEPLKPAYVAEIGTDLESMQKAVGGDIETVYLMTLRKLKQRYHLRPQISRRLLAKQKK